MKVWIGAILCVLLAFTTEVCVGRTVDPAKKRGASSTSKETTKQRRASPVKPQAQQRGEPPVYEFDDDDFLEQEFRRKFERRRQRQNTIEDDLLEEGVALGTWGLLFGILHLFYGVGIIMPVMIVGTLYGIVFSFLDIVYYVLSFIFGSKQHQQSVDQNKKDN